MAKLTLVALVTLSLGMVYAGEGDIQWRYTAGGVVSNGLQTSNGATLYVGATDGRVYSIETTNGTARWTHYVGGTSAVVNNLASGGSLLLVGGSAFSGALNTGGAHGTIQWESDVNSILGAVLSPDSSLLYAVTSGGAYCVNAENGTLYWTSNSVASRLSGLSGASGASLVLSPDGTSLYCAASGGVIALNTKGSTLSGQGSGIPYGGSPQWVFDGNVQGGLELSPDANTLYLSASTVVALNVHDGSVRWTSNVSAVGGVLSNDGRVYYAQTIFSTVYAIDTTNGQAIWSKHLDNHTYSTSPAGTVTSDGSTLYVSGGDGQGLVALNTENGAVLWSNTLNSTTLASAPILSSDNSLIFVADTENHLFAISTGHFVLAVEWIVLIVVGLVVLLVVVIVIIYFCCCRNKGGKRANNNNNNKSLPPPPPQPQTTGAPAGNGAVTYAPPPPQAQPYRPPTDPATYS